MNGTVCPAIQPGSVREPDVRVAKPDRLHIDDNLTRLGVCGSGTSSSFSGLLVP